MPYSIDSDENRENPFTPDKAMSLNDQFIYRFSALEETVRSGFKRVDENLTRITNDLHDRHIDINDRINLVDKEMHETFAFKRQRIDGLEKRLQDMETWSKVVTARFAVALSAVIILWTLLGTAIRNALGIS